MEEHNVYSEDFFVGTIVQFSDITEVDDGEYWKGVHTVKFVREGENLPEGEIERGLIAFFKRSCNCEHDCCAHWFGGVAGDIYYKNGYYYIPCFYSLNV